MMGIAGNVCPNASPLITRGIVFQHFLVKYLKYWQIDSKQTNKNNENEHNGTSLYKIVIYYNQKYTIT